MTGLLTQPWAPQEQSIAAMTTEMMASFAEKLTLNELGIQKSRKLIHIRRNIQVAQALSLPPPSPHHSPLSPPLDIRETAHLAHTSLPSHTPLGFRTAHGVLTRGACWFGSRKWIAVVGVGVMCLVCGCSDVTALRVSKRRSERERLVTPKREEKALGPGWFKSWRLPCAAALRGLRRFEGSWARYLPGVFDMTLGMGQPES